MQLLENAVLEHKRVEVEAVIVSPAHDGGEAGLIGVPHVLGHRRATPLFEEHPGRA